jgi:sialate O-acetylesterase
MKSVNVFLHLCVLTVTLILPSLTLAEVKLNSLFCDGMVLQRGVQVPIWGTAKDGERITVKFQNQTVTTTTKDGVWIVRLKPLKAGGPFEMSVTGDNTITVANILIGEVWLASGQSNMAFGLSRASNGETVLPTARDAQLRLFKVARDTADEPRSEAGGAWKQCTPETAADFSAVAYFFGRDLRKALGVPVGLIDASVGGTPAEAWLSRSALEADPELKEILVRHAETIKQFDAKPKSTTPGKTKAKASTDTDPRRATKRPACLYNAMIAPLQPYSIAGAIWYHG